MNEREAGREGRREGGREGRMESHCALYCLPRENVEQLGMRRIRIVSAATLDLAVAVRATIGTRG